MLTLSFKGHVRVDGILELCIPTGLTESEVVGVVRLQVSRTAEQSGPHWPVGFFEDTYGAFHDDPLAEEPPELSTVSQKPL